MTGNTTDLILNISRKAPWLTDGGSNVFPAINPDGINNVLSENKDADLTMINNRGEVYEHYKFLDISNGNILLKKPLRWEDNTKSFHIFFRNRHSEWNYIHVTDFISSQTTLLTIQPEEVYYLQKRRYQRVDTPAGTKAIFKDCENRKSIAHVQNISEDGMLMLHSWDIAFPVNSIITDIIISIPPMVINNKPSIRSITPLISKGEVVRSFFDTQYGTTYFGINFFYNSTYVKEKISHLVKTLDIATVEHSSISNN